MVKKIYKPKDVRSWSMEDIEKKFERVCMEKTIVEEEYCILRKEIYRRGVDPDGLKIFEVEN